MTPPASLRIMAVENDELMRNGIEATLKLLPAGIQPFIAKTAEDALQFFDHFKPHLVLTDYALPCMKGDALTQKLKEKRPDVKVIALSYRKESVIVEAMISSGADGYVYKCAPLSELSKAIETVMAGGFYFSGDAANIAANHSLKKLKRIRENHAEMSAREKEVMKLIYQEKTNPEIMEITGLSKPGVEAVRNRLYIIAKVDCVVGFIKYIIKNGLDDYCEK